MQSQSGKKLHGGLFAFYVHQNNPATMRVFKLNGRDGNNKMWSDAFIPQKLSFASGPILILTCNTVVWRFIVFMEKQSLYMIEKGTISSEVTKKKH